MGQAKQRRLNAVNTVYHHTSVLRTNLIWMSGVIEVEGRGGPVLHPHLGRLDTDATLRRKMMDFPPLAWFTSRIEVPRCLIEFNICFADKATGEIKQLSLRDAEARMVSLNRVALGFPAESIPVVRWPEHPGYSTPEGLELNETARDVGDDPNDWWVSEVPVDVMRASEVWSSRSMTDTKLQRVPGYLEDVKRMVTICRTEPGVYIPPTWVDHEQGEQIFRHLGLQTQRLR